MAGDLVPHEAPNSSLCWVFVYLYNVVVKLLLGKKNLEAGAAGEGDQHTLLHHQAVLHYTLPPPPPHHLLIIIILLLLLLILLLLLLFNEVC